MATPLTARDIAVKLAAGKELNKTEKKFYESNATAVENELTGISANDRSNITGNQEATTNTPAPTTAPNFNPLEENVPPKVYTGQQQGGSAAAGSAGVVPEKKYTTAPEEIYTPEKEKTRQEEKQEKAREEKTANPDLQNATESEKEQGAEQLAEVIFNTLGTLYQGVNRMLMISEKTIAKKQNSGEINTRVEVPYKMGFAPMSQVFKQYNEDAKNLLVIEEEWKSQVKPALVEELAKAGHGMSSRQFLWYMFTMKFANDGFKVFQFVGLKKDYLNFAKEQTLLARRRGVRPAPSVQVNEQEIEQESEQEQQPSGTLQDQALNKMFPHDMARPAFGSKEKLSTLNRLHRKDESEVKKEARSRIEGAKSGLKRVIQADPPPDGKKRGKGRPPGAKNKPKKSR